MHWTSYKLTDIKSSKGSNTYRRYEKHVCLLHEVHIAHSNSKIYLNGIYTSQSA